MIACGFDNDRRHCRKSLRLSQLRHLLTHRADAAEFFRKHLRIRKLGGLWTSALRCGRIRTELLIGEAERYGDYPCHRVVNHAGRTVPCWTEQRTLLEREGVGFRKNGCVDMKRFLWRF